MEHDEIQEIRAWSVNHNNRKLNRNRLFLKLPKTDYFNFVDNRTKLQVKIDWNNWQVTYNRTIIAVFEPSENKFLQYS